VMRNVIDAYAAELHDALAVTPQTNEVGRSAPLLAGLFDLVAACGLRRIRLLEVGASAGLNLLLDNTPFMATLAVRSRELNGPACPRHRWSGPARAVHGCGEGRL
jgi:hypothetical protein